MNFALRICMPTRGPNCMDHFTLVLAWVFVIIMGVAPASAEVVKNALDTSPADIKEENRCRTCVAIASVFLDETLKPAEHMYKNLIMQRKNTKIASQWTAGNTEAAWTAARQRIVTDIHTSIDGLCNRVKELHSGEGKVDQMRLNEDDSSGTKKHIRNAIDNLCTETLAELSEPLEDIAFQVLSPSNEPETTGRGVSQRTHDFSDTCKICEEQGLCTSYLAKKMIKEEKIKQQIRSQQSAHSWSANIFSFHWWRNNFMELWNDAYEDVKKSLGKWFTIIIIFFVTVGILPSVAILRFIMSKKQNETHTNMGSASKKTE